MVEYFIFVSGRAVSGSVQKCWQREMYAFFSSMSRLFVEGDITGIMHDKQAPPHHWPLCCELLQSQVGAVVDAMHRNGFWVFILNSFSHSWHLPKQHGHRMLRQFIITRENSIVWTASLSSSDTVRNNCKYFQSVEVISQCYFNNT